MFFRIAFLFICFFSSQIYASLPNKSAEFFANQANIEAKNKNYDSALYLLTQAIAKDPNYARGYKLRGNIYYALQNYNMALSDFNTVVRMVPNSANAYIDRAIVYCKLGNIQAALTDIEFALSLKPKSPFALLIKEQILDMSND